jgi:hypothetical protein
MSRRQNSSGSHRDLIACPALGLLSAPAGKASAKPRFSGATFINYAGNREGDRFRLPTRGRAARSALERNAQNHHIGTAFAALLLSAD